MQFHLCIRIMLTVLVIFVKRKGIKNLGRLFSEKCYLLFCNNMYSELVQWSNHVVLPTNINLKINTEWLIGPATVTEQAQFVDMMA